MNKGSHEQSVLFHASETFFVKFISNTEHFIDRFSFLLKKPKTVKFMKFLTLLQSFRLQRFLFFFRDLPDVVCRDS